MALAPGVPRRSRRVVQPTHFWTERLSVVCTRVYRESTRGLEIALRDQESSIRGGAIDALGVVGGDRAAKSLSIALHDENADLRERAVEALGQLGNPAALQFIEYAWVVNDDESVRSAAEAWLEALRDQVR